MERIGIICEYNPFHNGHIYHIKKIKEMYPDSILILVLNGYFLERGEISFLSKEDKSSLALNYGIDLILELPVLFGTQSADIFAEKAVTILNYFFVDKIIFGSEANDIGLLTTIAEQTINPQYQNKVKQYLKQGMNYPTALAKAIAISFDFNQPNDLLAISYIKAILKHKYPIQPLSIQRTSKYHDLESTSSIVSASNIRKKFESKEDITPFLPSESFKKMRFPNKDLFFSLLKMKILTTPFLEQFLTVDEGIEHRLQEIIKTCSSLEEFQQKMKTKRYTYNKMNRMFIHILLGITKEDNQQAELSYVRILGFNAKGQKYLNSIKKDLEISIIPNKDSLQYKTEMNASILYDLLFATQTYSYERKKQPLQKK